MLPSALRNSTSPSANSVMNGPSERGCRRRQELWRKGRTGCNSPHPGELPERCARVSRCRASRTAAERRPVRQPQLQGARRLLNASAGCTAATARPTRTGRRLVLCQPSPRRQRHRPHGQSRGGRRGRLNRRRRPVVRLPLQYGGASADEVEPHDTQLVRRRWRRTFVDAVGTRGRERAGRCAST